jgi:cell division protein FtsB
VRDLKEGRAAVEERARTDLGMVGSNETFFQVVPPQPAPAPPEEERRTAEATSQ